MRFVFAPDSFKGSISAVRAAQLLQEAARAHFPEAACVCLPVADGGEGTVDALLTICGGEARISRVTGPLGDATPARWALLQDGGAALEMAQASGLPLVAGRLNPLAASSRGTGEMLLAALRAVVVVVGGGFVAQTGLQRALDAKIALRRAVAAAQVVCARLQIVREVIRVRRAGGAVEVVLVPLDEVGVQKLHLSAAE